MINVLVHHKIHDYKQWKAEFDAAVDFRHQGGEQSCRIFHKSDDPNDLTLLFEWESLDKAQRFMASEELRQRMTQAGVATAPDIQYIAEMHTVRRSAAD